MERQKYLQLMQRFTCMGRIFVLKSNLNHFNIIATISEKKICEICTEIELRSYITENQL